MPCYPWRCLCLGLRLQITRTTPFRRTILQFSQIGLTLLRTFIFSTLTHVYSRADNDSGTIDYSQGVAELGEEGRLLLARKITDQAGASAGEYTDYKYTRVGSPVSLRAPTEPGDYEVRYQSDREKDVIFASRLIRVK